MADAGLVAAVHAHRQAQWQVGSGFLGLPDRTGYRNCKACEDYDLWMRVAKTNHLANLPQVLLHYRVHERGIISSARQKGVLEEPNRACIQRHAQELFHLSPQLYARLRERRMFVAALVLLPAAQAIARRAHVPLRHVLGSPSFLFSARCLTRSSDLLSRLLWGVCQRALAP
jgi:hypothetical protein